MRIFHTSDWHLGQLFYSHNREYEHQAFLNWLLEQIALHKPDALCIAGDIYDTINPPVTAQRMLFEFIAEAHRIHPTMTTVIIAGNHDSASRIELPRALLTEQRVHVLGRLTWQPDSDGVLQLDTDSLILPVKQPLMSQLSVESINYAAEEQIIGWCVALPFLRPMDLAGPLTKLDPMTAIQTLHQTIFDALAVKRSQNQPVVAVTHAHMSGGQLGDTERNVVIGNVEAWPAEWFNPLLDYVALGHLHRAQTVAGQNRIRYSGSPLPLSFSERHYKHQILLVKVAAGEQPVVTTLPVPRFVAMLKVPEQGASADLATVIKELTQLKAPDVTQPDARAWLEVKLLFNGPPPPDLRHQLFKAVNEQRVRLLRLPIEFTEEYSKHEATEPTAEAMPSPAALFERAWLERYDADAEVIADFAYLLEQFYLHKMNADAP